MSEGRTGRKQWSLSFGNVNGEGWAGPFGLFSRKKDAILTGIMMARSSGMNRFQVKEVSARMSHERMAKVVSRTGGFSVR